MNDPVPRPLILTAAFDPASAAIFQALRDRHFPPRLNIVPAHVTLLHKLPPSEWEAVDRDLAAVCSDERCIPFVAKGLRFLGRGVAFEIEAVALSVLRSRLAGHWQAGLGPQDAQPFRPHVTIQNKADPSEARALRDRLAQAFEPIEGTFLGLDLWHYCGGPWERAGHTRFRP